MTNLSCLSKAQLAIFLMAVFALSGTGLLLAGSSAGPVLGLAVGAALLAAYGFMQIAKCRKIIRETSRVSAAVRAGDFEQRILYFREMGDVGHLVEEVNEMINVTDAFVREAALAMEAASEGRYYRTIRPEGMQGAFLTSVKGINTAIDHMAGRDELVQQAIEEVNRLVAGAARGDLEQRMQTERFTGAYRKLAMGMNELLQTVARPIEEAGQVMSAYARTRLTERMTGEYEGVFAQLQRDTNDVGEKLTEIVGQLRATSGALKSATGEILVGANDLSERTTKQAATVEETSATVEQLSSTVMQSADSADDANGKSQALAESARETGTVVSRANEAMERINSSSAKISNIIGMIDDIAFQTNLLALNASVEAARAGEAGKGFAVVAVEVRRLAQSAAEASNEVKQLIELSANEVDQGTRLVSEAAEKLQAMISAIQDNSTLMQGIARASREQASSIDEVNVAVRQMDEMTQHNAALVEQTNAAIEQTDAQVGELDRIVDMFVIDGSQEQSAGSGASDPSSPASPGAQEKGAAAAARTYLSEGNAALESDWDEF